MAIKHDRTKKIKRFPVPIDQHKAMSFLATIGICRNWIMNFGEIARPLYRLTSKDIAFQWGPIEQVSFEKLRELASQATEIHGVDPTLLVQMYIDASKFAVGCFVS